MIDPAGGWSPTATFAINDAGDVVGWGFFGGNVSAYRVRVPMSGQATCQARAVCGGGDGDAICLYSDGVVEISPGHFVAVFGFDNASSNSVHPNINEVRLNGDLVSNPQPAPPADLPRVLTRAVSCPRSTPVRRSRGLWTARRSARPRRAHGCNRS